MCTSLEMLVLVLVTDPDLNILSASNNLIMVKHLITDVITLWEPSQGNWCLAQTTKG